MTPAAGAPARAWLSCESCCCCCRLTSTSMERTFHGNFAASPSMVSTSSNSPATRRVSRPSAAAGAQCRYEYDTYTHEVQRPKLKHSSRQTHSNVKVFIAHQWGVCKSHIHKSNAHAHARKHTDVVCGHTDLYRSDLRRQRRAKET